MDRTERFYRIQRMLRTRRFVPIADFLNELEVSRATFKRDIEYMRDRLNVPIEWDREAGRYYFTNDTDARELPGLRLSPREIHALLAAGQLLDAMEPGILSAYLAPLREPLAAVLGDATQSLDEIRRRIRRYGPDVQLLAPPALRNQVSLRAAETVRRYEVNG